MFIPQPTRARRTGYNRLPSCRVVRPGSASPWLEQLEERVLLSSGAPGLVFLPTSNTYEIARASAYLAQPSDVQLYRIADLKAGDVVTASINTSPYGGGLNSYLRILQESAPNTPIAANDNYQAQDAGLTFQAPAPGNYLVEVSSADSSHGLFDLTLLKTATAQAPLAPLTASSFVVSRSIAESGDVLIVDYTVENRGGADSAPFTASLLLSANNRFDDNIPALQSVIFPPLAAGAATTQTFTVPLNAPGLAQVFLGLQIDSARPASPEQGNDWASVQVLTSATVPASATNTTRNLALPLALDSRTDVIAKPVGDGDFFRITLTDLTGPGNLSVEVDVAGNPSSVTLYDAQGMPIVRSDGQSGTNPDPLINHGLVEGTYFLKVANHGANYHLTTLFTPSISILQTVPVGNKNVALVRGDFNGDGRLDFVTAIGASTEAKAFLGNGDGTFQPGRSFDLGMIAEVLITADLNGDGRLDLVAANAGTNGVRVLLGRGNGSFESFQLVIGSGGNSLTTGDFNGDGLLDVAVGNSVKDTVDIRLGTGLGTFQSPVPLSVPDGPTALATGDFDGDGHLDLAVTCIRSSQVAVWHGRGDGTFPLTPASSSDVGANPTALTVGDFNGDGHLDLATASITLGKVTVLRGQVDGTFIVTGDFAVANQPVALITGDLDGDGHLDLAAANSFSDSISVLLGQGLGTFQPATNVAVGADPVALVAGDFNGDGHVDLAAANYFSNDVVVLLGNGNGVFPQTRHASRTGEQPRDVATGDFNGDGRLDLATANYIDGNVTVLLGQGNGTFERGGDFGSDAGPAALVAGDFNGDGRLDLAVANYGASSVTILLGNGDGSFRTSAIYTDVGDPKTLAAGDFNGDGVLDLVVADSFFGTQIRLLLGDGHGVFTPVEAGPFTVGTSPISLAVGDFNGDSHLDLAVANFVSSDLTVLLGNGNGNFFSNATYPLAGQPVALVAGNFGGDARLDLAIIVTGSDALLVLVNDGNGGFDAPANSLSLSVPGTSLTAEDFDGDGRLDLAVAGSVSLGTDPANNLTVFLGRGDGTLQPADSFSLGYIAVGLVAGDFDGDARLDLAVADQGSSSVAALLGAGTGAFLAPVLAPSPVQSTPLIAKLTSDSVDDTLVLSQTGHILFRRGLTDRPGAFAPPQVLNPDPQLAARDMALVVAGRGGSVLAVLNANTLQISANPVDPRVARVTIYEPHADGAFTFLASLDLLPGFVAANIAPTDLNGDGLGDLVITAAGAEQVVFISLQTAAGGFEPVTKYLVGVNPSAITFVDANGDSAVDIAVTDRFSGQVSLLINQGTGEFNEEERYRAGASMVGLASVNNGPAVQSLEGSNGIVVGSFNGKGHVDLIVANSGTNSLTLLSGNGAGGFWNPPATPLLFTAGPTTALVTADFNQDGIDDLAVLSKDSDTVSIYTGDGQGGFRLLFSTSAGNQPTGLSVGDVSRPGGGGPDAIPDLLVGNTFGDLLVLAGNGDGTFSNYRRTDQKVGLAIADVAGQHTFFFSNQASDRLAFKSAPVGARSVASPTLFQSRDGGIAAPGPQTIVTVAGTQYLVVANSGANEVLIYRLDSEGQPEPESKQVYFTGTSPASITVADFAKDPDHIPDLATANEGSNDVSIFVGSIVNNTWTLSYRPRQSSGGMGPTSIALADVTGANGKGAPDGNLDLLVSNGQSNTVNILASLGNDGLFINQDADAPSLVTGLGARQLFVGNFDSRPGLDLVTVNTVSNDVTLIANFLADPVTSTIKLAGEFPTDALLVNLDGVASLVVANAGGSLELLQAGPGGWHVAEFVVQTLMLNPSDLAMAITGNFVEIYGTSAGSEIATLLATFRPVTPESHTADSPLPPLPGFPNGLILRDDSADAAPNTASSTNEVPMILDAVIEDFGNDASSSKLFVALEDAEAPTYRNDPPENPGAILRFNLPNPPEAPPVADENPFDEMSLNAHPRADAESAISQAADLYWQGQNDGLWPMGDPQAPAPRAQAEPMSPIVLNPAQNLFHSAPVVVELEPQAKPADRVQVPGAAAGIVGVWYALPLLVSHWQRALRRKLRTTLPKLWK